eukprot:6904054-Prymnesium_polylepis.2
MRRALHTYPSISFVAKADSDVYLHLPDLALQLRAVLTFDSTLARRSLYGNLGYFSLVQRPGKPFFFKGFAPNFREAMRIFRQRVARACSDDTDPQHGCIGPFPYAYGPLIALGRDAAAALVNSAGLRAELSALPTLLPDGSDQIATEDVWLGSALWRHVGGAMAVALFNLDERSPNGCE